MAKLVQHVQVVAILVQARLCAKAVRADIVYRAIDVITVLQEAI